MRMGFLWEVMKLGGSDGCTTNDYASSGRTVLLQCVNLQAVSQHGNLRPQANFPPKAPTLI